MTLEYPILEMDCDFGAGPVTGVFELYGDATVDENIRTGYLIGGRGATVNAILQGSADPDEQLRRGLHLDLGGGQHVYNIKAIGWEGGQKADGDPPQWGTSADPGTQTATSATGGSSVRQQAVLNNFLAVGQYDSRGPARLHYGEFHASEYGDGSAQMGEYKNVAIESPSAKRSADSKDKLDVSMTLIDTVLIREAKDSTKKKDY